MKKSRIVRWAISYAVSRSLTGRPADLRKLIRMARSVPSTVAARRFFDTLEASLERGDAMSELFLRIGRQLSPRCRRKIATNFIFDELVAGYDTARAQHGRRLGAGLLRHEPDDALQPVLSGLLLRAVRA